MPEATPERDTLGEGTLISHLLELRQRLLYAVVAIIICAIGCMAFANPLFELVATPLIKNLPEGGQLISTSVAAPVNCHWRSPALGLRRTLWESTFRPNWSLPHSTDRRLFPTCDLLWPMYPVGLIPIASPICWYRAMASCSSTIRLLRLHTSAAFLPLAQG